MGKPRGKALKESHWSLDPREWKRDTDAAMKRDSIVQKKKTPSAALRENCSLKLDLLQEIEGNLDKNLICIFSCLQEDIASMEKIGLK